MFYSKAKRSRSTRSQIFPDYYFILPYLKVSNFKFATFALHAFRQLLGNFHPIVRKFARIIFSRALLLQHVLY